jgi:hypothetical protein
MPAASRHTHTHIHTVATLLGNFKAAVHAGIRARTRLWSHSNSLRRQSVSQMRHKIM